MENFQDMKCIVLLKKYLFCLHKQLRPMHISKSGVTIMKYAFVTDFHSDSKIKRDVLKNAVGNENVYENNEGYNVLVKKLEQDDTVLLFNIQDLSITWEGFIERWKQLLSRGVNIEVFVDGESDAETRIYNKELDEVDYIEVGYNLNLFYLNQKKITGMRKAQEKGTRFGRKKVKNPDNFVEYYHKWKNRELTVKQAAEHIGMNVSTFFRHCKDYEKQLQG